MGDEADQASKAIAAVSVQGSGDVSGAKSEPQSVAAASGNSGDGASGTGMSAQEAMEMRRAMLRGGPPRGNARGRSASVVVGSAGAPPPQFLGKNSQPSTRDSDGLLVAADLLKQADFEKGQDGDGNKTLGNYTVLSKLGKGAYGKVKLCRDSNGQKVAIKIMNKSLLKRKRFSKDDLFQNVLREIAIMKKLKHDNVVKLFEAFDDSVENKLYLVIEYVENGAVMDGDTECEPLSFEKSKKYFKDLAIGLSYLHKNGIIHRDIKPENLLIDSNDTLKLSDFGVSDMLKDEGDDTMSRTAGTPAFLAPECCKVGTFSGKAADVWACGVTLYFFVYGKAPFFDTSVSGIYQKILNDPLDLSLRNDVPDLLKDLLRRTLDKDASTRITAEQLLEHPWLTEGGDSLSSGGSVVSEPTSAEIASALTNVDRMVMLVKLKSKMHKKAESARQRSNSVDSTKSATSDSSNRDQAESSKPSSARLSSSEQTELLDAAGDTPSSSNPNPRGRFNSVSG